VSRKGNGDHEVEIAPIAAAVGVAVGGAVVADQLLGVDGTIALAGISYLAYLLTYSIATTRSPAAPIWTDCPPHWGRGSRLWR
jgi:hypothetical protein